MINERERKVSYFGDDFFADARAAAPLAKAITERIYGKGCLDGGGNAGKHKASMTPEARRRKLVKINKVFLFLIPAAILCEIIAFFNGQVRLASDIYYFSIIVGGYFITKKKLGKLN